MSVLQQLKQQQETANAIFLAEQEIDAMTDVFNRCVPTQRLGRTSGPLTPRPPRARARLGPATSIVDACHKKCVPPKYSDGELNKGEMVCIDRCVVKYLEVHQKVGVKLQQQMEANNAAAGAPGAPGAPAS